MKKTVFTFILCLLLGALLGGCYYDNEETLYGTTCDTSNITYSGTIDPLLHQYCLTCHSGDGSQGGFIVLDTYEKVKPYIENGKLYNSITYNSSFPMPKGQPKLDDCTILKFKVWIDHGYPNN